MARIIDTDTGIEVTIGRNDPEFGSQPFVTVNTENTPEADHYGPELGLPKIAVHLNDCVLYDEDGKDYAENCEREKVRYKRAQDICAGYECSMDNSVVGANRYGRYAVVTENVVRDGYSVARCDRDKISDVATEDMYNGWQPVCYYDLDELAGDEPEPEEGDLVEYEGKQFYVAGVGDDIAGGEIFYTVDLDTEDTRDIFSSQTIFRQAVPTDEVSIVKRNEAFRDDRMPVRYGIARIVTMAVFNTIPSP